MCVCGSHAIPGEICELGGDYYELLPSAISNVLLPSFTSEE